MIAITVKLVATVVFGLLFVLVPGLDFPALIRKKPYLAVLAAALGLVLTYLSVSPIVEKIFARSLEEINQYESDAVVNTQKSESNDYIVRASIDYKDYFEKNSAELTPAGEEILDALIKHETGKAKSVSIIGNSVDGYARQRAKNAETYLIMKGFGENIEIATSENYSQEENVPENRFVLLEVYRLLYSNESISLI